MFEIVSSRLKIHEGAVLVGMLRSHGLAAQMWSHHTAGLEGELTFGGVRVMVPTDELDDALKLIATPVGLADEWKVTESERLVGYTVKYPDFLSLFRFFVKWASALGFVLMFALPVLHALVGLRNGVVGGTEVGSVLGHSAILWLGAIACGGVIAVLAAVGFSLFRRMDNRRKVRSLVAALILFWYYPLVTIVLLLDLILHGWGED